MQYSQRNKVNVNNSIEMRPNKYHEPTKQVNIRVPASQIEEVRALVSEYLKKEIVVRKPKIKTTKKGADMLKRLGLNF